MTTVAKALDVVLAAEHAAVFGYGVAGAHLGKSEQVAAREAEAAHRGRRDTLTVSLTDAGADAPAAAPAYQLPFPVTNRASALKLVIALEEATARAWYHALMVVPDADRGSGAQALTDCAVRATRWRRLAGVTPAVVAFPGI